jgi:alpha-glucosidase
VIELAPPEELALGLLHDDTLVEAPGPGAPVTISLWALDGRVAAAELRCAPDGEEELHAMRVVERRGRHARWACTIRPRAARLRYRFRLDGPGGVRHLTMAGLTAIDPVDAFDFTVLLGAPLARWPLEAVLYQIFPDRFDDADPASNVRDGQWSLRGATTRARRFGDPPLPWSEGRNLDFYGGDLAGIERRLDYLAALGVTGLFLNPIWPALSNHRYDLVDHARVDPHLGGDEALASLRRALARRGMRLVLDVVINHTGSGHPWFNRDGAAAAGGAFRDPAARTRDFYRFDRWPDRYHGWLGIDTLPRLDLSNPALRQEIFGEHGFLRRFLRPPFEVDGYRFDVANMIGRDGERQYHRPLWVELAAALRGERDDLYLVGEHFFDPDKLLKGDGLDGAMAYHAFTFPVRTWLSRRDRRGAASALDGAGLLSHLRQAAARVGWAALRRSSLHVNTHDVPRLQTLAGPGALDVATALQLALPGVPCLYYGDEVGLEGGADPDNRRCMEWDEARWDGARLERTRALVARRRATPALLAGGLVDLGSRGDVVAFARPATGSVAGGGALVVASRADREVTVEVPLEGLPGANERARRLTVPAHGAAIVDL